MASKMNIPITARKRKLITIATGAVFLIFVVLFSSSKSHTNSNIVIPDPSTLNNNNPLLSDEITVHIPGVSAAPKKSNINSNNSNSAKKSMNNDLKNDPNSSSGSSSSQNDSKLDTKKLTNANDLVKGKEGKIDETKVKEADSSDNIPLVAGDPTSKKAHDKNSSSKNIKSGSAASSNENTGRLGSDASDANSVGSLSDSPKLDSTSSNGIQADKELGSTEQKETLKKLSGESSSSLSSNKKPYPADDDSTPHKNLNSQIMEAQHKAEENGPSKDEGRSFNPRDEFNNILSKSPVVIFSKSYCPFSKKLKHLLKTEYHISPPPMIVELDTHENGKELQDHIGKETGRFTVPNFIIDGQSRGGADDIIALHDNDELIDSFHSWAAGAAKIKRLGDKTI